MGRSSGSRALAATILAALMACPASSPEPDGPSTPPAAGPLVFYAITAPDAAARLETFDVATGERTLIGIDERERFGELIGGNPGREERIYGSWIGSPKGQYVAYSTATRLRVAPAEDPLQMRTIARSSMSGSIGSSDLSPTEDAVLWSPDERRVFYLETMPGPKPPPRTIGFPAGMRLYEVTIEGPSPRQVARSSNPFLKLVGFDGRRRLVYWARLGGGGFNVNLAVVSLAHGRSRVVHPLPFGLPSTWMIVTTRADAAYFIRGRRIVRIDLPGGQSTVVYQGPRAEPRIQGLEASPDGRLLLFERRNEHEDTMTAYVLSLASGEARVVYEGDGSEPRPHSWSPDGRYLVLSGDDRCGRDRETAVLGVLDTLTGETVRIEPAEASCRGRSHPGGRGSPAIRFLSWLSV